MFEAERRAISKVASPSRTQNVAKQVGKLAPNNVVSLARRTGGGYFGDPLFTTGLWSLGSIGKGALFGLTAPTGSIKPGMLIGLPIHSYPATPYVNPLGASAATCQ
jgi:hypothetical protein